MAAIRAINLNPYMRDCKGLTYIFVFLIWCNFGELEKLGMKALPGGQFCHQVVKCFCDRLLIDFLLLDFINKL